jgi:hypothetical protein
MTSPTLARVEFAATLRPIPILVPTKAVATAALVRVWSPSVRLVADPPVAREVLVISAVPAHLRLAPL